MSSTIECYVVKEAIVKISVYIFEIIEEIYQGLDNVVNKRKKRQQASKNHEIFKWHEYYKLMVQWAHIRNKNIRIAEYLKMQGCTEIAIYGIGDIGKLCYDEIFPSKEIHIREIIDRSVQGDYRECPIVQPDHIDDKVDGIIITPICNYYEIAATLYKLTPAKLISLEDIVAVLNERI